MLLLLKLTLGVHCDIALGVSTVLLAITVLAFYGFGFALAGCTLIFKRIGQVAFFVQLFILLLVMAPRASLPLWAQQLSAWLPMVRGIELLNLAGTARITTLNEIPGDVLSMLLGQTLLFLGAGICLYLGCERYVRHANLLGQH